MAIRHKAIALYSMISVQTRSAFVEGKPVPALAEIPIQDPAIDFRQLLDIRHRGALVDLMHGLTEQAEFDHRTIACDETRVRCAAGGGELRLAAGDLFDRSDRKVGEWTRLSQEYVGVRILPHDVGADAVAGSLRKALVDELLQRLLREMIVEADVEFGTRPARDHVACGIADVDGGELEIGGLELRAAMIERLFGERHDQ